MAAWVEERVRRRFDRVVVERTAEGVPTVLAELVGSGTGRIVVYTHYDVQPAGDLASWDSDPFAADLRGGAVYARGTCDDKADITARLQALDYWLDANGGQAPVTILWVCEGAEEVGSPGLREVLARHADWLSASECLWESFVRRDDGRPEVAFGCSRSCLCRASRPTARARPARRVLARPPLLRLDADRVRLRASSMRRARWRSRASPTPCASLTPRQPTSRGRSSRRARPSAGAASPAGRPADRSRSSRCGSRTRLP